MIQILIGNNFSEKNSYIKKITENYEIFPLRNNSLEKEVFFDYANTNSLFGSKFAYIIEGILENKEIVFSNEEIEVLEKSENLFVFKEDKLLAEDKKKLEKYAIIKTFLEKKIITQKNNFIIADAYARRDKIKTWIYFRQAIEGGIEPEMISGMLFWKIKTMILNNNRSFTKEELREQITDLVSLYHKAHQGECDFTIGLEQFILASTTKA
jgi:hypothetical protein